MPYSIRMCAISAAIFSPEWQTLISGRPRRFQALVLNWVIESNSSFRTIEHESLRDVFEYLNPCVAETNAHMVHDTARLKLVKLFQQHQATVI